MATITNPILPGFHPDPSICRAGDTYYIATSTFEWWPGVLIYESKDLQHWQLVSRPLYRIDQLDLFGDDDSGGVWAPCLSYADDHFWLVYSNVRSLNGPYKDVHNYVVTAPSMDGPWSDPVYLNSVGFDPSLFHDDDGRKWAITMRWDHRPGNNRFAGIELQEYNPQSAWINRRTKVDLHWVRYWLHRRSPPIETCGLVLSDCSRRRYHRVMPLVWPVVSRSMARMRFILRILC